MPTILLVEDHEGIADILSFQLIRLGFSLMVTGSLEKAKCLTTKADIVILDWLLPDGEGINLLLHTKHIPVIMLTARATHEDKQTALNAGVSAFLSKPFSIKELTDTLTNLL